MYFYHRIKEKLKLLESGKVLFNELTMTVTEDVTLIDFKKNILYFILKNFFYLMHEYLSCEFGVTMGRYEGVS